MTESGNKRKNQPWQNKGFSQQTLLEIANYCYLKDKRTLSSVNDFIEKLFNLGIVSSEAFKQYLDGLNKLDMEISQVLESVGLKRNVTVQDRDLYRRWTIAWNMPKDVILYAATLASDKTSPIAYMSKILSTWHSTNIHTLEMAKKSNITAQPTQNSSAIKQQAYSNDDFESIFDAFKEIEI